MQHISVTLWSHLGLLRCHVTSLLARPEICAKWPRFGSFLHGGPGEEHKKKQTKFYKACTGIFHTVRRKISIFCLFRNCIALCSDATTSATVTTPSCIDILAFFAPSADTPSRALQLTLGCVNALIRTISPRGIQGIQINSIGWSG